MRTLILRLLMIATLLALAALAIVPPEKKLRLGKDLRGGVSLTYAVQIKPGDPPDVVERVIDVLKDRVDPEGQLDITMVKQGRDQIEITMPLPSERVKRLKAEFERALAELQGVTIDPAHFERIMRMEPQAREAEIARLAGGDEARAELLRQAARALDEALALRAELVRVREAAQQDPERIEELVSQTAEAEIAYEEARAAAMGATISPGEVRRALNLSDQGRVVQDDRTRQRVALPSPRQQALQRLYTQHPELKEQLDRIVEAFNAYAGERTRLDDPADLKRMLAAAGVLEFRITVNPGQHPDEERLRRELRERGAQNVQATDARFFKINKVESWYDNAQQLEQLIADPRGYFGSRYLLVVEEYDGEYWALGWDNAGNRLTQAEGRWSVESGSEGRDQIGRPAINFTMDVRGARLLADLTSNHVGNNMAVLLDDEIYTAPRLQSRISRSGQITGTFTDTELRYIIRVLAAGSLQAKLSPEPISESTVGPNLGMDNLQKGLRAGVIALVVIGAFMVVYYFGAGFIAVIALLCNAILLLAIMSLNQAAFTLPGIAGIILTFGMAVDANVLIYERMREEIIKGNDLRTSARLGFSKAMSAIVDGNVTNLIVCVVLFWVATPEIRGFAITLGVGVLTTLFSTLVISRQIFVGLVEYGPWQRASMLPLVIPAIDRILTPKINWLKLRYAFWSMSAVYILLGVGMVFWQGREMLDIDFRGGTQITVELRQDGQPHLMERRAVEERVQAAGAAYTRGQDLAHLRTATVLPINPREDGVTSDTFTIRTLAQQQQMVTSTVLTALRDVVEAEPALRFDGVEMRDHRLAAVFAVISGVLGDDIGRSEYRDDIRPFIGGVAIFLNDIEPAQPLATIRSRLEQMRGTPEFSDTLARQHDVRVVDGDESAVRSAVVLVRSEQVGYFDSEARWHSELGAREWDLVQRALGESTTPASVQNFSAAIASQFQARAVVAILMSFMLIGIYVWVRFGTLKYSLAAVVPLVHDVLTVIGIIALVEILFNIPALQPTLASMGLMPFKIDLTMVAAFLTLVGYSLNDSIVVMDRIRENRGKLPYASANAINSAVNQTISRTVITSGTTLFATIILYSFGGEGIRGFAFILTLGIIFGTYSTLALSAPIVWSRRADRSEAEKARREGAGQWPGTVALGTDQPAPAKV
jgi:SecD/SecF fusion protein